MPSGEAEAKMAQAPDVAAGFGLECADRSGITAMDGAGAGAAGATFGRAGSGREAAMEAAAAIGHGGLAAGPAAAGAGAAAARSQEVAGPGTVAQAAPPVERQGRHLRKEPMPSGGRPLGRG